jgi:hypothetical protein
MRLFIFLSLCLSFAASAKDVLFIGNSYTMQSRGVLQSLLKAEQVKWNMTFITKGGFTLAKHLQNPQNIDLMKSKKWDAIILQEQSQTPAYSNLRKGYFESLKQIQNMYKKDKTPIYLFSSWGRRDGDKQNKKAAPTYDKMQSMLDEAFTEGAKKYKMTSLPINKLWREVMETDPHLGKELYKNDGSHPSAKGAYLVALSLYCTLEKVPVSQVRFSGDLDAKQYEEVQKLATKIFTISH